MKPKKLLSILAVCFLFACASTQPVSHLPSAMKKATIALENQSEFVFSSAAMEAITDDGTRVLKSVEGEYGTGQTIHFLLLEEEDGIRDAEEIVLTMTLKTENAVYDLGTITLPAEESGIVYQYYIENVQGDAEKISLSNGEASVEIGPAAEFSAILPSSTSDDTSIAGTSDLAWRILKDSGIVERMRNTL